MIENSKVRSSHTRRAAIVYIRQSHPSQVEAFLLGIPNTGLLLVQSQAQPGHHRLRPLSCLLCFSAAEDHEGVRIIDDVRPILLALPLSAPVLQKPVHIQVGQQRTGHPTLGCALALTARHFPVSFLIPLFHRRFQPYLQQMQHPAIGDPPRYTL